MNRMSKLPVILCCILVLVCLFGCAQTPAESTGSPSVQTPSIDTAALYAAAVSDAQALQDLQLQVTCQQTVKAATETFTSITTRSAAYQGMGTEAFLAQVQEDISYGSYDTEITEIYAAGKVYASVYGTKFSADMSAQDFTARYTPAVLLDASLYGTTAASEADGAITLSFSDPTALETWLSGEDVQLVTASGTAVIKDGKLTETSYCAEYTLGGITFATSVKQTLSQPESITIAPPADTSAYTAVSFLDAPRLLEQAIGFLQESNSISSTITERTVSQAAAFLMNHQTTINTYGPGTKQMVKVDQSIYQLNNATGGASSTYASEELFRDGVYTMSTNGGTPEKDTTVTAKIMQTYYQGLLLENVLDMRYISNAVCTDLGSTILLEFTCTPAMGEALCSDLNYSLFNDSAYLNNLSSAYRTVTMDFYLGMDKYTGLPTSLGIKYEGQHTINGIAYSLALQADQSFDLASLSSYKTITGETAPETEPAAKPAPLFYKVTGSNGQQMWLFGTIHVGDDRTGFLPSQIYTALENADALAVECNVVDFETLLENDTALQQQVSAAYYYTDGTSAKDHIADSTLYQKAVNLMKVTGNYTYNTDYTHISLWQSVINNFYLRQGRSLTGDKGVDTRLLLLAKKQNKKILEVESVQSQLQMQSGWSDALQELLLSQSAQADALEYISDTHTLYELWCQGDTDKLTEAIRYDTSGLSADELKLYQEYTKAMETDRNVHMLNAAKEYLESGETVFYAVGLAHLIAEDGLVNTLRAAGYTVEQISYS